VLRHRLPWQKPYRGTLLNKAHPLAPNFSMLFSEGGGSQTFLHGASTNGAVGTSMTWQPGTRGLLLKGGTTYDDENNLVDFGTIINPLTWNGITIFFYGNFVLPTSDYPVLIANVQPNNYYGNYLVETYKGAGTISVRWYVGNNATSLDYSNMAVPVTTSIAVTWIKQSTAKIFTGGIERASGDRTNSWIGTNYKTTVNGYERTSGVWRTNQHGYNVIHIYNRVLPPAEIQQLHREPYAMFYPLNHARLVDPGIEDYYDEDQWVSFRVYQDMS